MQVIHLVLLLVMTSIWEREQSTAENNVGLICSNVLQGGSLEPQLLRDFCKKKMALGPYRVEWAHQREENATADFRYQKSGSRVWNCPQSILMEGCRANCTTWRAFPQFCLVSFPRDIFTSKILCPITEAHIGKVMVTITFWCCPSKLPSSRCPAIPPACLPVLEVQDSDLPFRL